MAITWCKDYWDFMTWRCAAYLIIFILYLRGDNWEGRTLCEFLTTLLVKQCKCISTLRWKTLAKWLRPTGISVCARAVKCVPWFHMIYSEDFLSLFYINYYLQEHCKNEIFFNNKAPSQYFIGNIWELGDWWFVDQEVAVNQLPPNPKP